MGQAPRFLAPWEPLPKRPQFSREGVEMLCPVAGCPSAGLVESWEELVGAPVAGRPPAWADTFCDVDDPPALPSTLNPGPPGCDTVDGRTRRAGATTPKPRAAVAGRRKAKARKAVIRMVGMRTSFLIWRPEFLT